MESARSCGLAGCGCVGDLPFHADDEVDLDVDLREVQGQDRLEVFCGFLREIGRRLGKPVLMDPEGDYGHPALGFDVEADRVVLFADSQVR